MTEQIENILAELKTIQAKLPEVRDLFWLEIDRYNEAAQQRGMVFDEKFEQQCGKLFRVLDSFSAFIEKSFTPSAEEIAGEQALQKLRTEFPNFNDWNEEAKKALLEREMNNLLVKIPQKIIRTNPEEPNRGPKYQINNQPDKIYSIDSDFSHCRPCFFEFRNKKYTVNNWAMILRELANILYAENSTLNYRLYIQRFVEKTVIFY